MTSGPFAEILPEEEVVVVSTVNDLRLLLLFGDVAADNLGDFADDELVRPPPVVVVAAAAAAAIIDAISVFVVVPQWCDRWTYPLLSSAVVVDLTSELRGRNATPPGTKRQYAGNGYLPP
jgi:hypothetical protein